MGILTLAVLLQWTFNSDAAGSLPMGWQVRGASPTPVYRIEVEPDSNRYLAARSRGSDVQVGTGVEVKAQDYPILSWRWRVWELPLHASERNVRTMDSAASVYVVFGSRFFPRILKYVWSTSEPAGTSFKHPRSGRMAIIVVASGRQSSGEWQTISRNILSDYKSAFGSEPGTLSAIGLKTDSDSTGTTARADYDDVRLEKGKS